MNLEHINDIHERAMDLAEAAFLARRQGDDDAAAKHFREALGLASTAAGLMTNFPDEEPMRSVLHRSAASLALACEEYRSAEKLVAAGLAGDPPEELVEELRDLLEEIYVHLRALV